MSATPRTRGVARTLGRSAATGVAALGFLLGAGAIAASPAQAACASDYRSAGFNGSRAEAHTEDCAYWSNSYAQHGGTSIWSGWYSAWSRASADVGVSFSYAARNVFD